jgi:hypothetical protein
MGWFLSKKARKLLLLQPLLQSRRRSLRNKGLDRDLDHIPANADIRDISTDAIHAGGDKGEAGRGALVVRKRSGDEATALKAAVRDASWPLRSTLKAVSTSSPVLH